MLDTVLCEFGERLFHHVGILLFHEGADSEILLEGGVVGVVVVLRKGERAIGGHDELLGVLTDLEDIISIEGQAHGGQILVVGGGGERPSEGGHYGGGGSGFVEFSRQLNTVAAVPADHYRHSGKTAHINCRCI